MSAHRGASPPLLGEVISKPADCSGLTAQIAAESTLETLSGKAIKVKSLIFFFLTNTSMLAKEILYWHSCIRMTFSGVGMSQKKN